MAFKKAERQKVKLRLGIAGPSGSGKTFTALAIASGMSDKICVIDSEYQSSMLYADKFDFDQDDLSSFDPLHYVEKINEAAKAGYEVVIIDSATHAWQFMLDYNQKIADRKFKGNTWSAWSDTTPKLYKPFITAILSYPGHVIATFRSKTETTLEKNDKGASIVTKHGTKIEQKDTIEYEFTIMLQMGMDNVALCTKSRIDNMLGKYFEKPGKDLGKYLLEDLGKGNSEQKFINYETNPDNLINSEMKPVYPSGPALDYGQKQEPGQKPEPAEKKKSVVEAVSERVEEAISRLDINHLNTVTRPGIEKLLAEKRMTEDAYKKCEKIIDDGVSKIAEIIMKREQSSPPVESPKIANPNLDSNGKALEVLF